MSNGFGPSGIEIVPKKNLIGDALNNTMGIFVKIKQMQDAEDAEKMKRLNTLIDVSMKGWMEEDKEELYNKRNEFVNRAAEIYRKTNGYPGFKEQQELDNIKDQLGSLMTESLEQQTKYKKIAETAFSDKTGKVDKEATATAMEELLKIKGIEERGKADWNNLISLNYDMTKYIGDSMNKWVDMLPQERLIYKKDDKGQIVTDVNGTKVIDYFETIKSVDPNQVEKWWSNIKKEPEIRKEALKRFQKKFGANPRDDKELDDYIDTYKPEFGTSKTFKGRGRSGSQTKQFDPSTLGPTTEKLPSGGGLVETTSDWTFPIDENLKLEGIPKNWQNIGIYKVFKKDITRGDLTTGTVGKNDPTVVYKKGEPVENGVDLLPGVTGNWERQPLVVLSETIKKEIPSEFQGGDPTIETIVNYTYEDYNDLNRNIVLKLKDGKKIDDAIQKIRYSYTDSDVKDVTTDPDVKVQEDVDEIWGAPKSNTNTQSNTNISSPTSNTTSKGTGNGVTGWMDKSYNISKLPENVNKYFNDSPSTGTGYGKDVLENMAYSDIVTEVSKLPSPLNDVNVLKNMKEVELDAILTAIPNKDAEAKHKLIQLVYLLRSVK